MSFHWDTPEFQVGSDVDDMLPEFEAADIGAHADTFERSSRANDGVPEMAEAVLADPRRRQPAGILFWPVPEKPAIVGPNGPLMLPASVAAPPVDEDEIPW